MDFPHRHGHGHRRDDDDDERRGPAYGRPEADAAPYGGYGQHPPPNYGRPDADPAPYGGGGYGQHPPPNYGRGDDYGRPAYGGGGGYGQPPPPSYGREEADPYGRAPPPAYGGGGGAYGNVVHVAHEGGDERPHYGGSDERPHYGSGGGLGGAYGGGGPGYGQETRPYGGGGGYGGGGSAYGHETRPHGGSGGGAEPPARKPTYRIFCKAGEDQYSLAVRDGKVCLIRTDQDDESQVRIAIALCEDHTLLCPSLCRMLMIDVDMP